MTTPAPESERAMKCEHGEDRFRCPYKTCVESRYADAAPAPASCSEVVERLVRLGYDTAWLAYESPRDVKWFRAEATKVLHEWREQIRKRGSHGE